MPDNHVANNKTKHEKRIEYLEEMSHYLDIAKDLFFIFMMTIFTIFILTWRDVYFE